MNIGFKKAGLLFVLAAFVVGGWFGLFASKEDVFEGNKTTIENEVVKSEQVDASKVADGSNVEAVKNIEGDAILQNQVPGKTKNVQLGVPFLSQAPSANWKDPIFQNGCEEASVLMANAWILGAGGWSASEGDNAIRKISEFEKKSFGHSLDTNAQKTAEFANAYFGVKNFLALKISNKAEIIEQLEDGKLVIVPAFGRKLGNPNFTSPGPITHMLVILGYDVEKKEFITNDPGTRKGKNYRYREDVLWDAIWDYPTANKHPEPPKGALSKEMIVVLR